MHLLQQTALTTQKLSPNLELISVISNCNWCVSWTFPLLPPRKPNKKKKNRTRITSCVERKKKKVSVLQNEA